MSRWKRKLLGYEPSVVLQIKVMLGNWLSTIFCRRNK